jgi:nitrogen fixation NifU-like protein
MRYETESCIFCQASASILAKYIKKNKVKNIKNLMSFQNFKFLLSKRYLSRKECVMLPIDAIKKAIK